MTTTEQEAISSETYSRQPIYSDHIYIGICTRQRPQMLKALLSSLLKISAPSECKITVCVVENDADTYSKPLVKPGENNPSIDLAYALEPKIGISYARNKLLTMALEANASILVFVDDDEQVHPKWLTNLYQCFLNTGRDKIIQGSVIPEMECHSDQLWLPFFHRKARNTGDHLLYCTTNNTLIPMEIIQKNKLHFDTSLAKSGGEDTVFFAQAKALGAQLIYCKEATVFETIPTTRANLKWLSARKLRAGILNGCGKLPNKPRSLARLTYYIAKTVIYSIQTIFFAITFQKVRSIRAWLNVCKSLGACLGFFKININPYKKIEGY